MEEVIMDQLITGLADVEIQRDVLSHPDAAVMNLEKLLQFIEGKESGQESQGLLSGHSVYEATGNPIKCKFCGSKHSRGRKFCKGAGKTCEKCGKLNHLANVCRSKVNNADSSSDGAKSATEIQSGKCQPTEQVEAAWGYQDSNWAGSVDTNSLDWGVFNSYDYENKNTELYLNSLHKKSSKKCQKQVFKKQCKMLWSSVLTVMTAATISTSLPSGLVSPTQATLVSQLNQLSHHVFIPKQGWVKQGARGKPLVVIQTKVDYSAYQALKIQPPQCRTRLSEAPQSAWVVGNLCGLWA